MKSKKWLYLFQCHNTHQLTNAGDIGVTETQQGEQSVGLSNERGERGHDPVSVRCAVLWQCSACMTALFLISNFSATKEEMHGFAT